VFENLKLVKLQILSLQFSFKTGLTPFSKVRFDYDHAKVVLASSISHLAKIKSFLANAA